MKAQEDDTGAEGKELTDGLSLEGASVAPVELPAIEPLEGGAEGAKSKDVNLKMILDLPVDVHVELGQARMNIQTVLNFSVGSVIELNRLAGDPVDIVINGKFIGKGEVVVVDENFGIRVTDLVDPEKRIESF